MDKKTYIIENRGNYRGMDWVVRFIEIGHRCGYVKIEDKAVFRKYEKEYAENNFILSLDVHGGITFIRKLADGNEYGLSAGNWLGFDAAHHLDLNDYQCARKYFGNNERYDQCEQINFRYKIEGASIKTEDYMIAECKSLIDQILAKSVPSVSTLESLVPPVDLCSKIPDGIFADSALIWCYDGDFWHVEARATSFYNKEEDIRPAPTLQEILDALTESGNCFVRRDETGWMTMLEIPGDEEGYGYDPKVERDKENPATAALKLWLGLEQRKAVKNG